ncbi:hypothetical protein [Sinomicrobium weinanense]|uniref:DUF7738 domain-containing protein n=1 Tax=Sinomicrobium weinanense TaxID=2842200 RepID=A0A926JTI6_9FLAO|nr:hypothetical protein [Sinomicrobium weinanense]MBC9797225.1 hypothetical protein [Sinomicrobium weinanense]MBU3125562.1 hypothetical protein [Sinomicrobium weinanense]
MRLSSNAIAINIKPDAIYINGIRIGFPSSAGDIQKALGKPSRSVSSEFVKLTYDIWDHLGIYTYYISDEHIWGLNLLTTGTALRKEHPKSNFKGNIFIDGKAPGECKERIVIGEMSLNPFRQTGMPAGYTIGQKQYEDVVETHPSEMLPNPETVTVHLTRETLFVNDVRVLFPAKPETLFKALGGPSRRGKMQYSNATYYTWDKLGVHAIPDEEGMINGFMLIAKYPDRLKDLPKSNFKGNICINGALLKNNELLPVTTANTIIEYKKDHIIGSSSGSPRYMEIYFVKRNPYITQTF